MDSTFQLVLKFLESEDSLLAFGIGYFVLLLGVCATVEIRM